MSTQINLRFRVSHVVCRQVLVEKGEVLPQYLETVLDLSQATPEQRAAIARLLIWSKGELDLRNEYTFDTPYPTLSEVAAACQQIADKRESEARERAVRKAEDTIRALTRALEEHATHPVLAHRLTEDALRRLPEDVLRAYQTAWRRYEAALPQFKAEEEARKKAQRKAREEAERKAREERERWEADKLAWIKAHGSDYLKTACIDEGYDCTRRYMQERAKAEFPGFVVDFNDAADWNDRSCPSEEALEIVRQVREAHPDLPKEAVKVVWLVARPSDAVGADAEDYSLEPPFEGAEAVVVWYPEVSRDKWLVREL